MQLNIQYIRPVHGEHFEVRGRAVRGGRTLVFATAELFDQQNTVCARCDGIASVVDHTLSEPTGSRQGPWTPTPDSSSS